MTTLFTGAVILVACFSVFFVACILFDVCKDRLPEGVRDAILAELNR